jgi:hypothetical protein
MAVEIRIANEVGWRELPSSWDAKRVMNLADHEWVEFENNGWCRASAVIEVREIPADAPKVPGEHESS